MHRHHFSLLICIAIGLILGACDTPPTPENTSGLQAVTAVPTLNVTDSDSLCAAAEANWETDWRLVIRALTALNALGTDCFNQAGSAARLYLAYVGLGQQMEAQGQPDEAVTAYQNALEYGAGIEATSGLMRLGGSAPAIAPDCTDEEVQAAREALPDYQPTRSSFIKTLYGVLALNGKEFPVYGVDYYPHDTPWGKFLTTDSAVLNDELDLFQQAGFNTLRIKLRADVLFQCPNEGAVPIPENIARLDALLESASAHDLRVILVLNDLPDLTTLYDSPRTLVEQTAYLVGRYRDEPTVLAWDLREGGDVDYLDGGFDRRDVLTWLVETGVLVRRIDSNHLITASWNREPEDTIPAVDFVSFTHFGDLEMLRQKIAVLGAATDKPLMLSAFGFSTFGTSETNQRDALQAVLEAAQMNRLAGWVLWTGFDFPLDAACDGTDCSPADSPDFHYGLWGTDYTPKLALDVVKAFIGQ